MNFCRFSGLMPYYNYVAGTTWRHLECFQSLHVHIELKMRFKGSQGSIQLPEYHFKWIWKNWFLTIFWWFFALKSYYNHAASADFQPFFDVFAPYFFKFTSYKCVEFFLTTLNVMEDDLSAIYNTASGH